MKTKYVLGFVFSRDKKEVVLIKKNRPQWQAGKMNGVGGHVEDDDASLQSAMTREFLEETGVRILDWLHFVVLSGQDFDVECFCATANTAAVRTKTDEEVFRVSVRADYYNEEMFVENLSWLIPLALDHLNDNRPDFVVARYP